MKIQINYLEAFWFKTLIFQSSDYPADDIYYLLCYEKKRIPFFYDENYFIVSSFVFWESALAHWVSFFDFLQSLNMNRMCLRW